ncbi:MAG: 16S rRNA (uracil(1498)-N(3))-methyltransferase, partial [Fulvivirga sp.]|nr:16S rRNA (uracil(1498)-N(3))-methyltransferase [Fulvivirga sp.]
VLRLTKGDKIELVDGQGGWYTAEIVDNNPKKCAFKIIDQRQAVPKNFYIHIAIAPTKNIDRTEWFVEKAVEIGIDEISFIQTSNSERKNIKLERIIKKAISAMKQSRKAWLPQINELEDFTALIDHPEEQEKFIAHVDFENPDHLNHLASSSSSYFVLIGPEGDFTPHEVEHALKHDFKKVSLGDSRLRTETAGIVACHLLNILNT